MRGFLVYLSAILIVSCGCHGLLRRTLPTQPGLPVAHHLPVGQLVFHSDFELERNDPLVGDLTAERRDICRTLGLPASDEPIDVYIFRDAETYGRYLARYFPSVPTRRAFFVESERRLAVYAHSSDRVAEDLRHEVAHGYLHSMMAGLPLWLDEGLAEFFEVPRAQNGLNRPHLDLLSDMRQHENWRPNLVKLEQLVDAAQMAQLDYAEAWAWVYYLLHSDPERRQILIGYLAELKERGAAEPLSRRLGPQRQELDRMLGDYLAGLSQGTTVR
jgi:hypothetical protein